LFNSFALMYFAHICTCIDDRATVFPHMKHLLLKEDIAQKLNMNFKHASYFKINK